MEDGVSVKQSGRTPRGLNNAKLTLTTGILRTRDADPKTNSAPDLEDSLSAQSHKTPRELNTLKQKTTTENATALGAGENISAYTSPNRGIQRHNHKQRGVRKQGE